MSAATYCTNTQCHRVGHVRASRVNSNGQLPRVQHFMVPPPGWGWGVPTARRPEAPTRRLVLTNARRKWYAIFEPGTARGVYCAWDQVKRLVSGSSNAVHKGFASETAALEWISHCSLRVKKEKDALSDLRRKILGTDFGLGLSAALPAGSSSPANTPRSLPSGGDFPSEATSSAAAVSGPRPWETTPIVLPLSSVPSREYYRKWYAVRFVDGGSPGVYNTWQEAEADIGGRYAEHRSFDSQADAVSYAFGPSFVDQLLQPSLEQRQELQPPSHQDGDSTGHGDESCGTLLASDPPHCSNHSSDTEGRESGFTSADKPYHGTDVVDFGSISTAKSSDIGGFAGLESSWTSAAHAAVQAVWGSTMTLITAASGTTTAVRPPGSADTVTARAPMHQGAMDHVLSTADGGLGWPLPAPTSITTPLWYDAPFRCPASPAIVLTAAAAPSHPQPHRPIAETRLKASVKHAPRTACALQLHGTADADLRSFSASASAYSAATSAGAAAVSSRGISPGSCSSIYGGISSRRSQSLSARTVEWDIAANVGQGLGQGQVEEDGPATAQDSVSFMSGRVNDDDSARADGPDERAGGSLFSSDGDLRPLGWAAAADPVSASSAGKGLEEARAGVSASAIPPASEAAMTGASGTAPYEVLSQASSTGVASSADSELRGLAATTLGDEDEQQCHLLCDHDGHLSMEPIKRKRGRPQRVDRAAAATNVVAAAAKRPRGRPRRSTAGEFMTTVEAAEAKLPRGRPPRDKGPSTASAVVIDAKRRRGRPRRTPLLLEDVDDMSTSVTSDGGEMVADEVAIRSPRLRTVQRRLAPVIPMEHLKRSRGRPRKAVADTGDSEGVWSSAAATLELGEAQDRAIRLPGRPRKAVVTSSTGSQELVSAEPSELKTKRPRGRPPSRLRCAPEMAAIDAPGNATAASGV